MVQEGLVMAWKQPWGGVHGRLMKAIANPETDTEWGSAWEERLMHIRV